MASDEEWMVNANEALEVSLVLPGATGLKTLAKFNPQFTYPIFGDDEQIFGYQGLKISLAYHATDMRPNFNVSYSKKFKPVGETEAVEIHEIVEKLLPPVAFQKKKEFEKIIQDVPTDWTPPGELVSSFDVQQAGATDTFEVWKGSLEDPAVKQIITRIQFLVPLYIEGGTFIEEQGDGDRWTVFFLYQKKTFDGQTHPTYIFAGYSTVYRFFMLDQNQPRTTISEDIDLTAKFDITGSPCRSRISQFIILPPFQGQGVGPRLYSTLYRQYRAHSPTVEITVEDPNEAFDDLRDVADLKYLRQLPEFNDIHLNTKLRIQKDGVVPNIIIDQEAAERLRLREKIAPRQFARVLEMDLMSKLPEPVRPGFTVEKPLTQATKEQKHELELWRVLVKCRVYRRNKDTLGQLEIGERIAKLQETVLSVEFDYARLLAKAERSSLSTATKRKLGETEPDELSNPSKKPRDA